MSIFFCTHFVHTKLCVWVAVTLLHEGVNSLILDAGWITWCVCYNVHYPINVPYVVYMLQCTWTLSYEWTSELLPVFFHHYPRCCNLFTQYLEPQSRDFWIASWVSRVLRVPQEIIVGIPVSLIWSLLTSVVMFSEWWVTRLCSLWRALWEGLTGTLDWDKPFL